MKTPWILAAALCSAGAFAQGVPVRIGVIGPFTGGSADVGTTMLNGIRMAVDEINAVGGYLGRPLELDIKDDFSDPEKGLAAANELVAEKVVATIGVCDNGVGMKVVDIFQQAKVPLVIPCATGTPLTAKFPSAQSFTFRTAARDAIQASFIVDDILKRGWNRVAVFADSTDYGTAGLHDTTQALAQMGVKPVYVARVASGAKDVTAQLAEARAVNANVILSYAVGPEAATIANGRKTMGWKVPQVGAWPLSFPNYIDGAYGGAEGSLMAQTFIADPSNERRAAFLSTYARKFNMSRIRVPMAAAQAYDATYLLTYALLGIRNGDLSGPTVKNALENIHRVYYGVVATYEKPFSPEDKEAISQNMLVVGLVRNAMVTFAYPEDARRNLFIQRKK
ncbi:ABC transporter substrate-binding protein [Hydrogenophaga sp. A37]|uniref:ABC transporter substrate-binding protein n=1 Tax=Hydrogenophaga sp. A37 TaxID=1945864 RepID=UPI000984D4C6|nr:ABC transporter substrate-binding protein [Hydrogenophaga sp. A37]OOG80787.1 ABC transporter substrate-binding protein [Hydrogenophaga sp. A37]